MFWKRSKSIDTETPTARPVEPPETPAGMPAPTLRIEVLEQRIAPRFGSLPPDFDLS